MEHPLVPRGCDDEYLIDYLFDLNGYIIFREALEPDDLREMNNWIDDHQDFVEGARRGHDQADAGQWIGHVETHTYSGADGTNFQNIIEAGPVFRKLINYPAWYTHIQRWINPMNRVSIHENLVSVRGQGGYIGIHCGGHLPINYMTFRQNNTGEWMVGQINCIMAMTDIGMGDGPTTIVPGSHKARIPHPKLAGEIKTYRSDEAAGKQLLAQYGVSVPRSQIAAGPDDAARAFAALTSPVAVKIMSPDLLHKSDASGVAIGLQSADAVRDAIDAMLAANAARKIDGFLVEEMAPAGREVVIGGVHAPQFGPMIMVGLGGVFVELLGDVAFRLCPIDEADAWAMLRELRAAAPAALPGAARRIIGHYLSHPEGTARPSATDLSMAWEPDLVWLITAVVGGQAVQSTAHLLSEGGTRFNDIGLDCLPKNEAQ